MNAAKYLLVLALTLGLAGCDSAEERAEKHYQSALELLDAGDVDRALVELRNVFRLNGGHREARLAYASIVRDRGNFREAYGQFLRLVEQYPDDLVGLMALAEMSFDAQDWAEFERHGARLAALAPDAPASKAVAIGLAYRNASLSRDADARTKSLRDAEALSASLPKNDILAAVLIDGYVQDTDYAKALAQIDLTLERKPDNRALYALRLRMLALLEDSGTFETQLADMARRFPEDETVRTLLIRYYVGQGQIDRAEAYMRSIADPAAEDPTSYLTLVRFLAEARGSAAAMAEIDSAIAAATANTALYRTVRAGLNFDLGSRADAIAELEATIRDGGNGEQIRQAKVALARIQISSGNVQRARELVDQVIAEDPSQVEALKMKAAFQIDADDVDGAINTLRAALAQSPQDAQAMTLMAQAYARGGSAGLARDYLSLAVEASGNAVPESLRYVRALVDEGRLQPAIDTLRAALRINPSSTDLLVELGRLYLRQEDALRVDEVIATLRGLNTEVANRAADSLQLSQIERRQGVDQAVAFLGTLENADNAASLKFGVIRARLQAGEVDEALRYAQEAVAAEPENGLLRVGLATALMAKRDFAAAEAEYRLLLQALPTAPPLWLELVRAVNLQGRAEDARKVLDEGIAANPDAMDLMWAKAGYHERDGDIEGAIAIYEQIYARASNWAVVANNLASLLSTYRTDQASLDRAYVIARRLRGTTVPAFQDTFGWIAYRKGELQDALSHLEPAAEALTDDAMVQYHLGMTYLALGRNEAAIRQFQKALDLAGEADRRPQFADARDRLTALLAARPAP